MDPLPCPGCDKAFAWGVDDDSGIVDAKGEQWQSCRENAHWKLTFHVEAAHPDLTMLCPRRAESGMGLARVGSDYWGFQPGPPYDDGLRHCSYCGSLHPDDLFGAIDDGCALGATDKSYKLYVDVPNRLAGQHVEMGSHSGPTFDMATGKPNIPDPTEEERRTGRFRRPDMGPAPSIATAKFYFQHLDEGQQRRFIDLYNERKLTFKGGGFYVLPFFMRLQTPATAG